MQNLKKERRKKKTAALTDVDNRLVIARGGGWIGGRETGEKGQTVKRKNKDSIFPISK